MKRAEAHSAVQPRRSVSHTRRLATFLADRKVSFAATRDWNPMDRTVPRTVETDTVTFLVPPAAWERVVLASSVTEAIEENPLLYIARLRVRSSRSVKVLVRPRFSTLARAAAVRTAVAA